MFKSSKLLRLGGFTACVLVAAFVSVFLIGLITINRLNAARSLGIYPSPAEGLMMPIESGYKGIREARIVHVTNRESFWERAHVSYVIACVWADSRSDGSPVGSSAHNHKFPYNFDAPGGYFINTPEGWVPMPERYFPLVEAFWMKVFGLQGDDIVEPFHDPSIDTPHLTPMCVPASG